MSIKIQLHWFHFLCNFNCDDYVDSWGEFKNQYYLSEVFIIFVINILVVRYLLHLPFT
jgi:hypothetical protein